MGILAAPPCILILKSWFSSPSGSLLEELDTLTQPGKDLVDWDSWSMTNVSMEPLQGYCLEIGMLGRGGQRHGGLTVSFYARSRTIANALICVCGRGKELWFWGGVVRTPVLKCFLPGGNACLLFQMYGPGLQLEWKSSAAARTNFGIYDSRPQDCPVLLCLCSCYWELTWPCCCPE